MYYDTTMTGKRIRKLRKARGMTQESLSEKIGVNASYLSRVERGEKGCSVDMFVNLSDVFSVTLDYLILGKSAPGTADIKAEICDVVSQLSALASKL